MIFITKNGKEGKGIFSSEIAEKENIPKKFLEGILRDLRNAQMLKSKRGVNGGYQLNKKPELINLTEIIRSMDGPIAMLPCVSLKYYEPCEECTSEEICQIKAVFEKVRDATLDIYTKTTLKDLI